MPRSMNAKRIVSVETSKHVLTFHTSDKAYNYGTSLDKLATLLGQWVIRCVGHQAMGEHPPKAEIGETVLPEGWYEMHHGVELEGGTVMWRRRTSPFYVEGRGDSDEGATDPQPTDLVTV
jgi:hypothetical protein